MRNRYWLAILAAVVLAVALRTLPMWHSPLPFNPDGIIHARLAASAVQDGRFPLSQMATDDLLFQSLLATTGNVLGRPTLSVAQPVSAFVGALPGLLGIAVTRRLAHRWGWSRQRALRAATLAGVLLAVEGLYLHRSMATDEQTVGLLFVPLGAIVVMRAHQTGRRSWLFAGVPLLIALGPLHNLDAVVLALVLTVATALTITRERLRHVAPLAVLTGGYWLYIAGYHLTVERVTPAKIIQQARLADVPGLLLAWILLVAVGAAWLATTRVRTQRLLLGGAFGSLFGLLAVNTLTTVFPGTPSTHPVVLAGLLPLGIPVAMAILIVPWASRTRSEGIALTSLFTAPFVLLGVAVTASLTPVYLTTAYRTTTFLHFPVLVLAALGTLVTAKRLVGYVPSDRGRIRIGIRGAVALGVIVAATASIPIAFGGLSVLNYKGVTTPAELSASTFAASHATEPWASDNHLVRIQPPDGANGTEQPVYTWLRGGNAPPDCLVMAQESWTTSGAQFYPAPPENLSRTTYHEWLRTNTVVYHSGAGDSIVGVAATEKTC